MRDSTKIEEVKFEYHGIGMVPVQTYVTPRGEIYVGFKRTDGSFVNIHTNDVKKYIINGDNR
jgi:hypothetical protein